jgi:hypothetical protein
MSKESRVFDVVLETVPKNWSLPVVLVVPEEPTSEELSAPVVSGQVNTLVFYFDIKDLRVYLRRLYVAVYILCLA